MKLSSAMRGGHVDAVSRTHVSGWAADAQKPSRRLELCVLINGVEAGRVTTGRLRPDLAALGKYGDGKHGFSFSFPLPLEPDIDNLVSVRFADDGRPLPNGDRLVPREAPLQRVSRPVPQQAAQAEAGEIERPAPILVTAPGRSGTTYLMSCLAASPQIAVAELVPYELRLLSYYAMAFGVLTAPADTERSTHPDRLEGNGFSIGFNPFSGGQYLHAFKKQEQLRDFFGNWAPARLGEAIADTVREYYRRLAADQGKPGVTYFAEKNNNLLKSSRMFVRRVFGGMREIVIVRDPRDTLCSHMAYFSSTRDRALHHLTDGCEQLTQIIDAGREDMCVIRYEDMIRGHAATFDKLRSFLGAEVRPVAGNDMFRQHGTSETPEASIGRWRHDLPVDLRERAKNEWRVFLDRFGYDLE
jgi:hypothetical protein